MKRKKYVIACLALLMAGLYFYSTSEWEFISPVSGSHKRSYDQNAFGAPRVGHKHKGVDIFAKAGTPVISATKGIVIYTGVLKLGGNVVLVLGPAFKTHYYAHLKEITTHKGSIVTNGTQLGTVGNTGNAINTPSHLHYSIGTILPKFRLQKADPLSFYVNPVPLLNNYFDKNKK